jgi:uncharacterized protein YbaP (TraB family)
MWELQGTAGHVTFVGSIHLLREDTPVPPAVLHAADAAEVIVLEIDLDKLDPAAGAADALRLGVDPGGRTLAEQLGPRDYAVAASRARAAGVDLEPLQSFRPWLAAITVTQMKLQEAGFDADYGVERRFVEVARRDGKEVRGLETLPEQLESLAGLSPGLQRDFLLETLDEAGGLEHQMAPVIAAWRTGDTRTLERELLDDLRGEPELYRRVIVDRNRRWATRIAGMARERRNTVVVVGTLHLVGPDSVLRMLDAAGLKSRQLGN